MFTFGDGAAVGAFGAVAVGVLAFGSGVGVGVGSGVGAGTEVAACGFGSGVASRALMSNPFPSFRANVALSVSWITTSPGITFCGPPAPPAAIILSIGANPSLMNSSTCTNPPTSCPNTLASLTAFFTESFAANIRASS